MNTGIVVMAAGMGSRFGGLKQAEPIGPNGEMIIDYSVADAVSAGFNKAVIIIRKDIEKDFRLMAGKRIEKMIDTEYVFQEKDSLPEGFICPDSRQKPWGTGHAILCAKDAVNFPFTVINADDFYGSSSFKIMHDYLVNSEGMCMAGYKLGNTLSENGSVSRGVCETENGFLKSVTEVTAITKDSGIPLDTIVSMNMWGLRPDIFNTLEKEFKAFLNENISEPKAEFFLPSVISKMIAQSHSVKVLTTDEQWYGITYREDLPLIRAAVAKL